MKRHRLAVALIAAGTTILCGAASAGDVYLRAGIGLDRPTETTFTDGDCSSASPAALYGCGQGSDGAPYRSRGEFGTPPVLEAGLGYAATPAIRIEALIEYRPRLAFDGRANFLEPEREQSVMADLSSLSAMLAGYIDLPGLGLPKLGPLVPFVGAGAGWVRTRIEEMHMTFPRTTTVVPGASRTGFGWMVAAGVSASLGERVTLGPCLALHGPRRSPHRPGRRPGCLARREPRAPAAKSRRNPGAAAKPRAPAVPALWVVRRQGGRFKGDSVSAVLRAPTPVSPPHRHQRACAKHRVGTNQCVQLSIEAISHIRSKRHRHNPG